MRLWKSVGTPTLTVFLNSCVYKSGCQNQKSCSVEFSDHLQLTEDDCNGICLKPKGAAFEFK